MNVAETVAYPGTGLDVKVTRAIPPAEATVAAPKTPAVVANLTIVPSLTCPAFNPEIVAVIVVELRPSAIITLGEALSKTVACCACATDVMRIKAIADRQK
jgi:hypothetical protein